MAKNKNRQQGNQQQRGQQQTPQRGGEQQTEPAMPSDSPSPANIAERSRKQKKFGHN
ncbi:hypothetical protein [Streptomyces boluensis]|nr:hypothetical protein [Streptomyces boluensis]